MPVWVQRALHEVEAEQRAGASHLVWVSQVSRAFHLAEPLRATLQRRWWDLLAFRLALVAEHDLAAKETL